MRLIKLHRNHNVRTEGNSWEWNIFHWILSLSELDDHLIRNELRSRLEDQSDEHEKRREHDGNPEES
jgi:hypothetical protein